MDTLQRCLQHLALPELLSVVTVKTQQ
jgi:hypothetical protein